MVAVAFVTWMIFWRRRTARHLKAQLHGRLDAALALGGVALVLTAFLAVGREGLETAVLVERGPGDRAEQCAAGRHRGWPRRCGRAGLPALPARGGAQSGQVLH